MYAATLHTYVYYGITILTKVTLNSEGYRDFPLEAKI